MKKKKIGIIILIAVLIIIVLFAALIGYKVYSDLKQEDILKQEIVNLSNKNLETDDYSITVVTTGDYAYIEESIKKFYLDLSTSIKTLETTYNNPDLINILSAENLQSDGPEFINSYKLLEETQKNTQESLNTIINLCNEENILNLLDKDKVDDYYIDLYKELMYTDSDKKEFEKTKTEMEELSKNANLFLDKVKEMLDMLKNNKGKWEVEEGQLYFTTTELVNSYNKLYQELNDLAEILDNMNEENVTNNNDNLNQA